MPAGVTPRTTMPLIATAQGRLRAVQALGSSKISSPQQGIAVVRKRTADMRSPRKDVPVPNGMSDSTVTTVSSVGEISDSSVPLLMTSAAEYRELPLSSSGESFLSDPSATMPSSDFTQVTALPTGEQTILTMGNLSFLKPSKYVFPRPEQKGATSGQQAAVCEVNVCAPVAKKRHLERRRMSAALRSEVDVVTLYLLDQSYSLDGSRYRAREGGSAYSKSPRRHSPRTKQPKIRSLKRQKAQTSLSTHSGRRRSQRQSQPATRTHRRRTSSPRAEARTRAHSPRLSSRRSKHVVSREHGNRLEVTSFTTDGSHSTIIVSSPGKSVSSRASTRSSSTKSTKSCKPLQDLTAQLGNRNSIPNHQQRSHVKEESSKSTSSDMKSRLAPSRTSRGRDTGSCLQTRPDTSASTDSVVLRGSMKSRNCQLLSVPRMRTSTPLERLDDGKRSFIPSLNDTISSVNTNYSLPRNQAQQAPAGKVGKVLETSDSLSNSRQSRVITSTSDGQVTCISETVDIPSSTGKMEQVLDVISRIPTDATKCEKNDAFLMSPNIVPPKTSTPIEREKRAGPLISTPKTPSPKAKRKPVVPEERPRPEGCSFSASPRALSLPGDSVSSKESVEMNEKSLQRTALRNRRASESCESDRSLSKCRGKTDVDNSNAIKLSIARSNNDESKAFPTKVFCMLSMTKSKTYRNGKNDQHQFSSRSASSEFDPNSQHRPDISGCSQPSHDSSFSRSATSNSSLGQDTFTVTAPQQHPCLHGTPMKVSVSDVKGSPPKCMRQTRDVRKEASSTTQSISPVPRSPRVQSSSVLSMGKEIKWKESPQVSIHTSGSSSFTDEGTSSWSALCTPATARKLFSPEKDLEMPQDPTPNEERKRDSVVNPFHDLSDGSPKYSYCSSRMEVACIVQSVSPRIQTVSMSRSPLMGSKGSPLLSPRRCLFGGTENRINPEYFSPKSPTQTYVFKDEINRQKKDCKRNVRRSWLNFPPPAAVTKTPGVEEDRPGREKSPLPLRARPAQSPRSMKRKQISPSTSPTGSDTVPEKRRKKYYAKRSPFRGQVNSEHASQKAVDETSPIETWKRRPSSPMPALRSPLLPQSFSERMGSSSPFNRNSTSALDKSHPQAAQLPYGGSSPFSRNQRRQSPVVPMAVPRKQDCFSP